MSLLPPDIQRYCACMDEVNARLSVVEKNANSQVATNRVDTYSEAQAIQFRKILELIAFGSLIANREKYSAAHSNYTSHWKAKELLENLTSINPNFYPVPLKPPRIQNDGTKHFALVEKTYLTHEQFISLYDHCGSILHTHNPYSLKRAKHFTPEGTTKWVKHIKGLLTVHLARLVDSTEGWVVFLRDPNNGQARAHQFQALDHAP